MPIAFGLPRARNFEVINSEAICDSQYNQQFLLKGTNPSVTDKKRIYFLQYVQATGTFTISGNDDGGPTALTGSLVSPLDLSFNPMRLDGGFTLTGTILVAKGFFIEAGKIMEV